MLKGKAKIDFEEWYKKEFIPTSGQFGLALFWSMKPAMQQGVYLEFFRGKGIEINIQYNAEPEQSVLDGFYQISVYPRKDYWVLNEPHFKNYFFIEETNYNTAFTHAINKACELYGRDLK